MIFIWSLYLFLYSHCTVSQFDLHVCVGLYTNSFVDRIEQTSAHLLNHLMMLTVCALHCIHGMCCHVVLFSVWMGRERGWTPSYTANPLADCCVGQLGVQVNPCCTGCDQNCCHQMHSVGFKTLQLDLCPGPPVGQLIAALPRPHSWCEPAGG